MRGHRPGWNGAGLLRSLPTDLESEDHRPVAASNIVKGLPVLAGAGQGFGDSYCPAIEALWIRWPGVGAY